MAPEYAMPGYLTNKVDVYSFGIIALEIASGRSNITYRIFKDEWLSKPQAVKPVGNLE